MEWKTSYVAGDDGDGGALLGDGSCELHVVQQGLHGGVWDEVSSMSEGHLWIFIRGGYLSSEGMLSGVGIHHLRICYQGWVFII